VQLFQVSLLFRNLKLPKGASLHTLRHTHGSHLLAAGVPLTDVSKRLGHSNPHVTATVYAHAMPGHDDLAAQAWEKFQKNENGRRAKAARKAS
jgi:integrase